MSSTQVLNTPALKLYTVGDIAKRNGVTFQQARYALDAGGVEPAGRIGIIRVWSESQLPAVASAIARTSRRPQPIPA